MIHHVGVFASELTTSRPFYRACLAPLGVTPQYQDERVTEFWLLGAEEPSLSLEQAANEVTRGAHLAFVARKREAVDAFFAAGIASGGVARHAPRHWREYRAYCAFVSDPDGNNIEAVHKEADAPT